MRGKSNKKTTPMDICIGNNIKKIRKQFGYTQTDLARALNVTFQQIQKYEVGENRITAVRLNQIAKLFETPIEIFFNE